MANMTAVGQLKGSGSGGAAVTDLTVGSGLLMTGTTLSAGFTGLAYYGVSSAATGGIPGASTTAITSPAQPWTNIYAATTNFTLWSTINPATAITVGTGTLTIVNAGKYIISLSGIGGTSSSGTGNPTIQIVKNGTSVLTFSRYPGNTIETFSQYWIGFLTAGDIVTIRQNLDSGVAGSAFGLFHACFIVQQA
jgi:hypothetical protein